MSVEQIQQQIEALASNDLIRLTEWLKHLLTARANAGKGDWVEAPEVIAELDRRLIEFMADPTIAEPLGSGYFQSVKQQLEDARAQKPSAC